MHISFQTFVPDLVPDPVPDLCFKQLFQTLFQTLLLNDCSIPQLNSGCIVCPCASFLFFCNWQFAGFPRQNLTTTTNSSQKSLDKSPRQSPRPTTTTHNASHHTKPRARTRRCFLNMLQVWRGCNKTIVLR